MTLRRALIKDRQIQNCKSVACTGIGLDRMIHSRVDQAFSRRIFCSGKSASSIAPATYTHPVIFFTEAGCRAYRLPDCRHENDATAANRSGTAPAAVRL